MNNFTVYVTKTLLSSFSAITIILSAFLIVLIINMWTQEGMPPFENIKFNVALFFVIIMLLVICQCLKYYTDMATNSREHKNREKSQPKKPRNDDVAI